MQTQEQKQLHWANMLGGFSAEPKTPTYINRCMDKFEPTEEIKKIEIDRAREMLPRRAPKVIAMERKRMAELLVGDISNRDVYKAMLAEGYLVTSHGTKVKFLTFAPVIGKIRKKEKKPVTPNINSQVNTLIRLGKTYQEIADTLRLNKEQMTNVFARLRISLMGYRQGKVIQLR